MENFREADIPREQLWMEQSFKESDWNAVFQTAQGAISIRPVRYRASDDCYAIKEGDTFFIASTMPGFLRFELNIPIQPAHVGPRTYEEAKALSELQTLQHLTAMQTAQRSQGGPLNPEVQALQRANLRQRADIAAARRARGERS